MSLSKLKCGQVEIIKVYVAGFHNFEIENILISFIIRISHFFQEIPKEKLNEFLALADKYVKDSGYPHYSKIHGWWLLQKNRGDVQKSLEKLKEILVWRVENDIDDILAKPITPEIYKQVRYSQLIGMSGYSKEGVPVVAVGLGKSTLDKVHDDYYIHSHIQMNEYCHRVVLPAATEKYGRDIGHCIKVLDMKGLSVSTSNKMIKLLTNIATIDELYYPGRTETYYIVNAPLVFYAAWKVLKPRLQEQTRKKIVLLSGDGKDELLKIMDESSLPHFCRKKIPGYSSSNADDCFSLEHPFHIEMQSYIKQQQALKYGNNVPVNQVPVHVTLPKDADKGIAKALQASLQKSVSLNRCSDSSRGINDDWSNVNFGSTMGF